MDVGDKDNDGLSQDNKEGTDYIERDECHANGGNDGNDNDDYVNDSIDHKDPPNRWSNFDYFKKIWC